MTTAIEMPVAWWPFKNPLAAQSIAVRSDESSNGLGVAVGVAVKVGFRVGVAVGRGRFVAVGDADPRVIVGDALLSGLGVSDGGGRRCHQNAAAASRQ